MFKNQLQELAQRSCFNLPSYACIREGPDHAPKFKSSVNFNGEIFESPTYSATVRQAEHAAAEAALNSLAARVPSKSLTAMVLDESGVCKNLLQETAHRAGLKLPVYATVRSGPGHAPVFTSTVEIAGMSFSGEAAKTKKQAEKNAAIAAWSALKRMPNLGASLELQRGDHQENAAKWSSGNSNIGRVIRRNDQHQYRGRMQRPNQRDNNIAKSNSFLSLLPPPPPPQRTASKILPPNWPKDCHHPKTNLGPLKLIDSASQIKVQESQPPPTPPPPPPTAAVEERQRDDCEWIGKICNAIKKEGIGMKGSITSSSSSSSSWHVYGGKDEIYSQCGGEKTRISLKIPTAGDNQKFYGAKRIAFAPAVQIRSVIPVCAAPRSSSQAAQLKVKEASST